MKSVKLWMGAQFCSLWNPDIFVTNDPMTNVKVKQFARLICFCRSKGDCIFTLNDNVVTPNCFILSCAATKSCST